MASKSLNRFKKVDRKGKDEDPEELKKKYDDYLLYARDCTDSVFCQYLCRLNDYSMVDVFKNINTRKAGMSFNGSENNYEIVFSVITDIKNYKLDKPADVEKKVFNEVVNHMDTLIRMDVLFKERFSEYLNFQNSRKNSPKHHLVDGGKIFLRSDKTLYYVGNRLMTDEHIKFVKEMREVPIYIGMVINKAD